MRRERKGKRKWTKWEGNRKKKERKRKEKKKGKGIAKELRREETGRERGK